MTNLADKECLPCRGGIPPLKEEELENLAKLLPVGWSVINDHHLEKLFAFRDFKCALAFVNQVGALAEEAKHHPDIEFGWGRARISIHTHKINGLTESDFVFAAKCDKLFLK